MDKKAVVHIHNEYYSPKILNILFHSSVDGHLDCFHVLAFVNSAAVNLEGHVSFGLWFPQDIAQLCDWWVIW